MAEFQHKADLTPISTNLDGLEFPSPTLDEQIIRKFDPNYNDFLNTMDPGGDMMPDFIDCKLKNFRAVLEEEICTYLFIKLKAVGLSDDSISILANELSNAKMSDLSGLSIQKPVLQELLMKMNSLRVQALANYIDDVAETYVGEQEQTILGPAMIAADRMYIKQDNGCEDIESEKTEILESFKYLVEQINHAPMVLTKDPDLKLMRIKSSFYEEVIKDLQAGKPYRLAESAEKLILFGGENTSFKVDLVLILKRLRKINRYIELNGRKVRSVIA